MQKAEAEAVRELLLELLDERHEAGPTTYVVQRATVEPSSPDDWALVLVFQPTADAEPVEVSFATVATTPDRPGDSESLAWHVYNGLEAGRLTP